MGDSAAVGRYLEAPLLSKMPAFMMDAGILRPFRYATGGTLLAARLALEHGIAINLGGGYHHAKPDQGEGFCVYADMPIAVRTLQAEGLSRRTLIVDLDVHQGNGTAVCLGGDPNVFLFDMHQGDIYPVPKETCTLDVELQRGTDDAEYLRLLGSHLPGVFERSRPDLVFLQSGVDTLAGDPLAHLAMTQDGIVQRDAMVIDECVRRGVPVVMVLGGGYSPGAWSAQFASIRRTIETYGLSSGQRPYPPRGPTVKEKLYVK
jgi:histone deacetylase 11